jgi:hypothetical protein
MQKCGFLTEMLEKNEHKVLQWVQMHTKSFYLYLISVLVCELN